MESYNYVLLLEDDIYYIGYTKHLYNRLVTHFNQYKDSAKIIKLHKPVKIIEVIRNRNMHDENQLTNKYIKKYGRNHVYGSYKCSLNPNYDSYVLDKIIKYNNNNNKCKLN